MMMKHVGVDPERDLKIVPLGAERARFGALRESIVDVAVVSPPADSEATKYGLNVVSRFYEIYKMPFTGLGTHLKNSRKSRTRSSACSER
jgi:hypothetical protein